MFLLDTNVIAELRRGKPAQSEAVRAWASGQPAHHLYLSSITVLELERGVLAMERRDVRQGGVLRHWLDGVLAAFDQRILPFTDRTARLCAALHVPDSRSERDAMIAATALEHGFAIATRNIRDFENIGVTLVDPWRP